MQGVTRNPLADPGILGVNAGAALCVVIAISVFGIGSVTGYIWFALAGAALASVAVYGIAALGREGATPLMIVGGVLALGLGRALNTLSLGDDVARGLGARVGLSRAVSAFAVVLLCGAATAAAGPIGFVGLTVPHAARLITGPDYRWILPYSMVLAPTCC